MIVLSLLGLIATFTIPKILGSDSGGKWRTIAKEAAASIISAYSTYQLNNGVSSATTANDFVAEMNFVARDITSNPSSVPSGQTAQAACSSASPCLQLHNGALLQYSATNSFNGTTPTSYITFSVDPDGTGTQAGSVTFLLYYTGRITSGSQLAGGDTTGSDALTIVTDPAWLNGWNG